MFHALYKLSKSIIIPVICIIIEIYYLKKRNMKYNKFEICAKWFLFWTIGFGSFTAGLMQVFNPSYTAALLNVTTEDYIVIQELGCANIGIGLLGLVSIKLNYFKNPAAVMGGVFILGATVIHLTRLHIMDFSEIVSLFDDVWILIVACFAMLYKPQPTK